MGKGRGPPVTELCGMIISVARYQKGVQTMARKKSGFRKLFTAAALLGAAAAGTWYYLKGRNSSTAGEAADNDEDFDSFDSFDDLDEPGGAKPAQNSPEEAADTNAGAAEGDAAQEEEAEEEEEPPSQEKELHGASRSYVSLDLKKARDKADEFFSNVSGRVEDTVNRIRSSEEFETVAGKMDEAVTRIRNSEEFGAVTGKINEAVDRIRNSNEYANVDEQMEHALNRVREATEKAVNKVGQKINATVNGTNAAGTAEEAGKAADMDNGSEEPCASPGEHATDTEDPVRQDAGSDGSSSQ